MDYLKQIQNILVVCESHAIIAKLKESLAPLNLHPNAYQLFHDVETTINKIHEFISENTKIDLIISDIFFHSSDTTVIGLINELEKYHIFHNTPILIFTNVKDKPLLDQVKKSFIHLPFRIVFTETTNAEINQIFHDLLDFKLKNEKYLELETKIDSIIEMKNRNLINPALQMVLSLYKQYPEVCRFAKVYLLLGKLYFSFWKNSNVELHKLTDKMGKISLSSPENIYIKEKIAKEKEFNEKMLDAAQQTLEKSVKAEPDYWKAIDALYRLYMEKMDYVKAKECLSVLIKLYPQESKFSLGMGKIHEMNDEFNESINYFLQATEKTASSGVGNMNKEDIIDIIDTSLLMEKKMMRQLDVNELMSDEFKKGSNADLMLKSLRKSNAQLRTTLQKLSLKFPNEPDLMNKIAITYRRTGENHLAEKFYKKALKLDPENIIILINYAMCLAISNVFDKAIEVIEKANTYKALSKEEKDALFKATEVINLRNVDDVRKFLI